MSLPPLPVAVARANGEIATVCTHPHTVLIEDPDREHAERDADAEPARIAQREEWTSLKEGDPLRLDRPRHRRDRRALHLAPDQQAEAGAAASAAASRRGRSRSKISTPSATRACSRQSAIQEHFDRTSDALRRYLGARFGFDGLESTTDEILASLKKQATGFIRMDEPEPGTAFVRAGNGARPDRDVLARGRPREIREPHRQRRDQCATSITTGESIVRGTMPYSQHGRVEMPDVVASDPVAARACDRPEASRVARRSPSARPTNRRTRMRARES